MFNETTYFNDQTRAEVEAEVARNKAAQDAAEVAYYRAQGWPVISIDSTGGDPSGGSTPTLDLSGGYAAPGGASTNWLLYGGIGLLAFVMFTGGRRR